MPIIRTLQSFWRNLAHRDRAHQELDEEIRSYTELLTEEKIRSGSQARRKPDGKRALNLVALNRSDVCLR